MSHIKGATFYREFGKLKKNALNFNDCYNTNLEILAFLFILENKKLTSYYSEKEKRKNLVVLKCISIDEDCEKTAGAWKNKEQKRVFCHNFEKQIE